MGQEDRSRQAQISVKIGSAVRGLLSSLLEVVCNENKFHNSDSTE